MYAPCLDTGNRTPHEAATWQNDVAAPREFRVVVSFGAQSFPRKRESTPQTFGMPCRRIGFLPPWRDGNDRRLERIPIPNDTRTEFRVTRSQFVQARRAAPALRDSPGRKKL